MKRTNINETVKGLAPDYMSTRITDVVPKSVKAVLMSGGHNVHHNFYIHSQLESLTERGFNTVAFPLDKKYQAEIDRCGKDRKKLNEFLIQELELFEPVGLREIIVKAHSLKNRVICIGKDTENKNTLPEWLMKYGSGTGIAVDNYVPFTYPILQAFYDDKKTKVLCFGLPESSLCTAKSPDGKNFSLGLQSVFELSGIKSYTIKLTSEKYGSSSVKEKIIVNTKNIFKPSRANAEIQFPYAAVAQDITDFGSSQTEKSLQNTWNILTRRFSPK